MKTLQMQCLRKPKAKVLVVHQTLWERITFLPVGILAAVSPSHEKFASKLTCTSTMGHSHSSVHSLVVVKPSVRSKTSRFTPESTRTGGPTRVHKAAVKASEQEGICVTTSVATLGIGPLNAPFAAPTTTARMYLRPTWSSVSSLHSARCNFSASNPKRSSLLIQRRRYRSQ